MRRWLALQVDHPEWVRPCADCEPVHEANGRRTLRVLLPGSLRKPPCEACPKIPAGQPHCPSSGKAMDATAWADVLRWYLRGKAVGFSPAPGEAIPEDLADLAGVVAGYIEQRTAYEDALVRARKPVARAAGQVLNWVAFG